MTLTIIHYLSNGAMVHDEGHRNVPYSVFCYALGDKPPRYPVPAISYVLHNERGNIWSWSHGWFMTIRDRYNSHRVLRVFKS